MARYLQSKGSNAAICGDHNIDLLKSSTHPNTQNFLESCAEINIIPTILKPTRITHSSASLIDNIFLSNCIHESAHSWIIIEDTSDHLPCLTSIEGINVDASAEIFVTKRSLTKKTIEKIKQDLDSMNWTQLFEGKDCETSFNKFHDILLKSIDKFAPEKKVKKNTKSMQVWMSKGLLKCLRKQKILYSKSISKNHTEQDRENDKEYKSLLQRNNKKSKTGLLLE